MRISSSIKKLCISVSALALVGFMSPFVSPASAQLNEINEFDNIDQFGDIELSSYAQEASLSIGAFEGDILAFKAEVFSVPQYGDKCVIETIWERWSDGALIEAGVMNSAPFSCDGGESLSQKDQAEFVACDSVGYDPVTRATSYGPPCDDDGGGGNGGPGSSTGGGIFGNGGGFGSGGGEFGSPIGVSGTFAQFDDSTDGGSDAPDTDEEDGDEEEPDVCTPEANLLAQQMRAALADARTELFELGGLVYRTADGTLGTSPWVRGPLHGGVDIFSAQIPAGATIIAGWHTHQTGNWPSNSLPGAIDRAGQFFSPDDLAIANPEYVGTRRGLTVTSGSSLGFLGLGLGLNTTRRSGLFYLRDNAIDTSTYAYSRDTIMDHADEITNCGL